MRRPLLLLSAALLLAAPAALAYPEFHTAIQKTSGRGINCAFCHTHPDGPEGVKPGQVGSLSAEAIGRLNQARLLMEPGPPVDSPILNEFGDHLLATIGKSKLLAIKATPEELPSLVAPGDLDDDGISDADEVRDGTLPTSPHHGDPWKLLRVNLQRYAFHILMLVVATLAGLWGIGHLFRWFGQEARRALQHSDAGSTTRPKEG